jgi:guanosine-3',5'-bis(diphosphate) 3'-pyrophosphohydrolase
MITADMADRLASLAHGDARTKLNVPFIDHVRRVASLVAGDEDETTTVAALLHDAVEKTATTWDDLIAAGADAELLAILDALTHRDGESYTDYLRRCATNPVAFRVKAAELADKMHGEPGPGVPDDVLADAREVAARRLALLRGFAGPGPAS